MTAQAISATKIVVSQTLTVVHGTIKLSSSYATGGEAVTAAGLGIQHIDKMFLTPQGVANAGSQYQAEWDAAAGKVVVRTTGLPTLRRGHVAGGAAGNITCTGIQTTDVLFQVLGVCGGAIGTTTAVADQTGEFTISATNTINNTSGTATVNGELLIAYYRPSDAEVVSTTDLSGVAFDFVAYQFA